MVAASHDPESYEQNRVIYTADLVVFGQAEEGGLLHVLLIRRVDDADTFPGAWALPGGCVKSGETSQQAARRKLFVETGIDLGWVQGKLKLVGVYDDPNRDPRGRVVSVAYAALVEGLPRPTPGPDAANAEWVRVGHVMADDVTLAFDHTTIIVDAYTAA